MKILNSNEFDNAIASGIVLVDFYADWCGVQAIPNLIIFKDGKAVDQITGFVPENEIVKHLQNLL